MKNKNKLFTSIAVLGSAIFGMVLTAGTGVFEALGIFSRTTTGAKPINVVLDESNAYSSGTSQTINTTFGENPIVFDYSNGCSAQAKTHVYMLEDATVGNYYKTNNQSLDINWNNKLTSIESIKAVFNADTGASLQFRASYDGKTNTTGEWGEFAPLTSNTTFTLASNPYYIELKAVGGPVSLTSCEICFSCIPNTSSTGTPKYETGVTINGGEKKTYSIDTVFDSLINGSTKNRAVVISDSFDVSEIMSDGTTNVLKKGDFTYRVTNSLHNNIDTSKPFPSAGTYTAYVKAGSLPEFSAQFEVSAILVESISILDTLGLNTNNSDTLVATILPENASNKNLSWSSTDESVATVDSTGKVTAHKAGQTFVTASSTDVNHTVSNKCKVTVEDIDVELVTLSESSLTIKTNQSETITATVSPSTATDKTITWSSNNESVATVSGGTISSLIEGEATITATASNGVSASCVVTVSDDEPADPNMQTAYEVAANLTPGGSSSFSSYAFSGIVVGTRTSGQNKDIYVQSGDYGLDLYNSGKTPSYKDKVEVEATLKNYSGTLETATVSSFTNKGQVKLPKSKQITSASDLANAKQNIILDFTGVISELSASGSSITGSNDVTITATAPNGGDVTIFAKRNSYSTHKTVLQSFSVGDTITISNGIRGIYNATNQILLVNETVVSNVVIPVTGVSVSPKTTNVGKGRTVQLTATVSPFDASNKSVSWTSSDPSIATVNDSGLVTGVKVGSSATITARTADGGFTDSCEVTVQAVPVDSVSLSQTSANVTIGNTLTLTPTVSPSDATNKNVSWTSSSTSVATVTNGVVTPVSAGSTVITVTTEDGNKTATCSVTVKEPVVLTSISVSGQKTSFTQGDTFSFGGTVTAHYSDNTTANVTSSASFSGYDMSTPGTQTVTVTCQGKTTTYQITVAEKVISLTSISVSSDHRSFKVGDTFIRETVTAHYDNGGADRDVTNSATFSGYDMSTAGTQTVTVSYTEKSITKTTSYSITVSSQDSGQEIIIVCGELESASSYDDGTISFTTSQGTGSSAPALNGENGGELRLYINNSITITGEGITKIEFEANTCSNNKADGTLSASVSGLNGFVWEGDSINEITFVVNSGKQVHITKITITCGPITPVSPTSITISGTSELVAGQSAQLSLTFNSGCNQKEVTWSSEPSTVVSVDQTGKITASNTATVGQSSIITATSTVAPTVKGTIEIEIVEKPVTPKSAWTIMIYMCGSNLEYDSDYPSDDGFASQDLEEILSANIPVNPSNSSDKVNIIVQTGGIETTGYWDIGSSYLDGKTSISATNTQRWEVQGRKLHFVMDNNTSTISSESELESFLKWGLDNYEAERYAVIMWDHGAGIGGCLNDDATGLHLKNSDIARASEAALNSHSSVDKFDFIAYDCCLMGCADIASVNADYYKYMIGSQETEYAGGYDYDEWLKVIKNNPTGCSTISVCDSIAQTFLQEQCYKYFDCDNCLQTNAVYDLSYMDELTDAFNSFVTSLNVKSKNDFKNKIVPVFKNCHQFGVTTDGDEPDYDSVYGLCDFKQLVEGLATKNSVSATAVLTALAKVVPNQYNHYCEKYTFTPCGMNAFVAYTFDTKTGGEADDYWFQVCKSDYQYDDPYSTKFKGWQYININYAADGEWHYN